MNAAGAVSDAERAFKCDSIARLLMRARNAGHLIPFDHHGLLALKQDIDTLCGILAPLLTEEISNPQMGAPVIAIDAAIRRNIRLALAYLRMRAGYVMSLIDAGVTQIPADIQPLLDRTESDLFREFVRLRTEYSSKLRVSLFSDITPHESLFVEIRVKNEDLGEIPTVDGFVRLDAHTVHYLRREDVEGLLAARKVEELSG